MLTEFESKNLLKEIGIPFSRKIRELSKERGKANNSDTIKTLFKQASAVIDNGYLSSYQRDRIIARLNNVNGSHSFEEVQIAKKLSQKLLTAQDVFSVQRISNRSKAQILNMLDTTLDIICSEIPQSTNATNLVSKLYRVITGDEHSSER